MDIVCLRRAFLYEKERNVGNVAVIDEVLEGVGPEQNAQSSQNCIEHGLLLKITPTVKKTAQLMKYK